MMDTINQIHRELLKDFSKDLTIHVDFSFTDETPPKPFRVVQIMKHVDGVFHMAIVGDKLNELQLKSIPYSIEQAITQFEGVEVNHGNRWQKEVFDSKSLTFSNRIFLYTDEMLVNDDSVRDFFTQNGNTLIIRDDKFRKDKWARRKCDVFICHDSRDKEEVAEPLYIELFNLDIKAWFDKTSLLIGDSLTEKLEEGIRECDYGILVLSKNFLSNERWAKNELQSLKAKQVISNNKVILPVWHGVNESDIIEYSYWLADKVGGNTKDGIAALAKQIQKAILNRKEGISSI